MSVPTTLQLPAKQLAITVFSLCPATVSNCPQACSHCSVLALRYCPASGLVQRDRGSGLRFDDGIYGDATGRYGVD
jgi:hypothetical protein